ncbi:hypothetical protein C8Q76DRAFT_700150 [Earliella scabrosa]|nr:hypothetical protein C8Q76DRAFT_700150 [Earliella scabrosa]
MGASGKRPAELPRALRMSAKGSHPSGGGVSLAGVLVSVPAAHVWNLPIWDVPPEGVGSVGVDGGGFNLLVFISGYPVFGTRAHHLWYCRSHPQSPTHRKSFGPESS